MPNQPLIISTVKVTAKDINGNNIAKQFNSVSALHFDYAKGMVNIIDATGQFYFPLTPLTTLTYTITTGIAGAHVVVMS
jgi:hypothetical protein